MAKINYVVIYCFLIFTYSFNLMAQAGRINLSEHPRLLMSKDDEVRIKLAIESSEQWKIVHQQLIKEADAIISNPLSQHVVIGHRLLEVSRETLRRTLIWGYAYRTTGEEKYINRAKEELINVCEFSDWNPIHFLDVAEMTTAVAIGYDWFYHKFSEEERSKLRLAIRQKGIEPSLNSENNGWLDRINNWNQVCNTGIAYGALAIYEDIPSLADMILSRSIESIKNPMGTYAPKGAYPEGYSYWGYGTIYNVMMIDALEKNMTSDSGLSQMPGFLKTSEFILHMIAPDQRPFNYGDSSDTGRLSPAMFWFANKNNDSSLLWNEKWLLKDGNPQKLINYRLYTLAMIWGAGTDMENIVEPKEKIWISEDSRIPVALMRTSWEKDKGLFLGIKGGTATSSHTHLDVGSFILVNEGIRWAIDFTRADYHLLESKGIDLWNKEQDSDRWKVFTYNNLVHNTLTFDGNYQVVDGHAKFNSYDYNPAFSYATLDMSDVYAGQVQRIVRGAAIVDEKYAVIRDEFKTNDKATSVRWTMLTEAAVEIKNKNTIELTLKGKKLLMEVESPAQIKLKTWSTEPSHWLDKKNIGTTMVGFEANIPADTETYLLVKLIPQEVESSNDKIPTINKWNIYKK